MAVVEEFMIGNTHIRIHDDYCKDKTKADVDKIMARIAARALDAFSAAAAREERRREKETSKETPA